MVTPKQPTGRFGLLTRTISRELSGGGSVRYDITYWWGHEFEVGSPEAEKAQATGTRRINHIEHHAPEVLRIVSDLIEYTGPDYVAGHTSYSAPEETRELPLVDDSWMSMTLVFDINAVVETKFLDSLTADANAMLKGCLVHLMNEPGVDERIRRLFHKD